MFIDISHILEGIDILHLLYAQELLLPLRIFIAAEAPPYARQVIHFLLERDRDGRGALLRHGMQGIFRLFDAFLPDPTHEKKRSNQKQKNQKDNNACVYDEYISLFPVSARIVSVLSVFHPYPHLHTTKKLPARCYRWVRSDLTHRLPFVLQVRPLALRTQPFGGVAFEISTYDSFLTT